MPLASPKALAPVRRMLPTTASLAVSITTSRLGPVGAKPRVRSRRCTLTKSRPSATTI